MSPPTKKYLLLLMFIGFVNDPAPASTLSSVRLDSVEIHERKIRKAEIQNGALIGWTAAGTQIKEKDFLGASLGGIDSGGKRVKLKIKSLQRDVQDAELILYEVLYLHSSAEWRPICIPDKSGSTQGVFLSGTWDSSGAYQESKELVTIGCLSSAIGKCVRWGYKPWKTNKGISLTKFHQACTRMVRADYLGDGNTYTQEGREISFTDILGIHSDPPPKNFGFEAAWGPGGAVFVRRTRFDDKIPPGISCNPDIGCRLKKKKSSESAEVFILNYS